MAISHSENGDSGPAHLTSCCNSPLRRPKLLRNVAVAPSLGLGLDGGTSPRIPGGPTDSAHTDRGKDVFRAGSDRGRSVATLLPPRGSLKTRSFGEAQHAEFHIGRLHTNVRPERAESRHKRLQHGLLYKGLHGPSTYHHCSCRRRIARRGSASPRCCRSIFAGNRLLRTGFAEAVHGLDAAVPSRISGGGRW